MEMGLHLYTPNFQVSKPLIYFRFKKGCHVLTHALLMADL